MRSSTWPGRRSPAASRTATSGRSATAGWGRRSCSPGPWPPWVIHRACSWPRRRSATTERTGATRCWPRTAPRERVPGRPGGGLGGGDPTSRGGRASACRARAHGHRAVGPGGVSQASSSALHRRSGWTGGGGAQWVSWIGIDDLLDVFGRSLVDGGLGGPVNAVAPHPVRNREYATTLAHVLRRPSLVPVPAFGPRLLFGRRGGERAGPGQSACRPGPAQGRRSTCSATRGLEQCLRHQLGHVDGARMPAQRASAP